MKVEVRSIRVGMAWALIIALGVAIVPTFMDWRLNPGGLFHGGIGTHWGVVLETAWTWFWPVFLGVVPLTVLVHAWVVHEKKRKHVSEGEDQ
jgi:hypothetical protein